MLSLISRAFIFYSTVSFVRTGTTIYFSKKSRCTVTGQDTKYYSDSSSLLCDPYVV